MATTTLQAESAPANPIVAAYLAARANEQRFDANQCQTENVEARLAQYAEGGGRDYAMSWGINDGEHAALVALLTADRLQHLIDGFSRRDDLDRRVVTFGIQELYEVERIKSALVNLWRHLDAGPNRKLKPLALDLGLIDKKDNARD
jgi:hypothetical protein